MKLKDGLILREVAGQYVIVPTGKRVQEVTNIVYISSSAAYLWEYMKDHEFEKEDLVKRIMEHYTGVTEEKAAEDVEKFLKILADNNIMDDGKILYVLYDDMASQLANDNYSLIMERFPNQKYYDFCGKYVYAYN